MKYRIKVVVWTETVRGFSREIWNQWSSEKFVSDQSSNRRCIFLSYLRFIYPDQVVRRLLSDSVALISKFGAIVVSLHDKYDAASRVCLTKGNWCQLCRANIGFRVNVRTDNDDDIADGSALLSVSTTYLSRSAFSPEPRARQREEQDVFMRGQTFKIASTRWLQRVTSENNDRFKWQGQCRRSNFHPYPNSNCSLYLETIYFLSSPVIFWG